MDCPHIPELNASEFGDLLRASIGRQRIPVSGSMELTFRCNLRCAHCYVAHGHCGTSGQAELSDKETCDILDQLADEGCLWLLLTGGEPLLRPDFLDVYTYAKRKGFLVTLFTNGTLLTPRIADHLAEWPPRQVEITLYGRTHETYERVTGVPGSYARCMRGIELLLERGVPLGLKTMLLTLNKHELRDMQAYARELGLRFRYDAKVNAGLGGTRAPLAYRLDPEEIVQYELADAARLEDLRQFCERFVGKAVNGRHLYSCGAGLRSFHIDPYGKLSVCMMSRVPSYDLRCGSFREGWREFRDQEPQGDYRCSQCELLSLCGQCPGWARLENGDPEQPVAFLCRVAHLQAAALGLTAHVQTT
jgi:radical SAM protein with 4Fe4S-binding SPASM domain